MKKNRGINKNKTNISLINAFDDKFIFYEVTKLLKNKKISKENIEEIIFSCVNNKRMIVEEDEFDTGKRQLLNFGHTIGHAIEKCSSFEISHGKAVAIGMVIVTKAAQKNGFCDHKSLESLISILEKADLPLSCSFDSKELASVALSDKKRKGNSITLVIPYAVGDCRLYTLSVNELESFIEKGLS